MDHTRDSRQIPLNSTNAATAPKQSPRSVTWSRNTVRDHGRASRSVRLMKIILPSTALALLALVVAWPQLRENDRAVRAGAAQVQVTDFEGLTMINPRFIGVDSDGGGSFEMTAARAFQKSKDAIQISLVEPKADLMTTNDRWLALSADDGIYDKNAQTVKLDGAVTLFRDDGYVFETTALDVDLQAGVARSDQRVTANGPAGSAFAEGIEVVKRGERIILKGQSKLILTSARKP